MAAAAFFDVDGTLVGKHIVHQYIFIRQRMMPTMLRPLWTGAFYLIKGPYYKLVDRISRTTLNTLFYRNYAGLNSDTVKSCARPCFEQLLRPHVFSEGTACIAEHQRAGRRIVFVTGSIHFIIAPLAEYLDADDIIAPQLVEREGLFTGQLDGPPLGHDEKARRVRDYARTENIDLSASFAYGDSIADMPMLREVGHPHAINPDRPLAAAAKKLGWPTSRWTARGITRQTVKHGDAGNHRPRCGR